MSENNVALTSAAFVVMNILMKKEKKKKRWWLTQLYRSREVYNGSNLLSELKIQEASGHFQNFIRMSSIDFELLINKIGHQIGKKDTQFRKAVPVKERLAITLRFLATGDSFSSMQYLFKVSKQLISAIVPEVCQALVEVLKEYVKMPSCPEDWLAVSERYEKLWNFPHCIGAVDGKHVVLQSPVKSGSEFYNYKSTFSIVLFALVDGDYNFLYADAGCQGRISDGGVFKQSQLYQKMENKELQLPTEIALPGKIKKTPYVFVGDEAFALSVNLMKPFSGVYSKGSSQRLFNYRLSRSRRIVENVFGISSAIFRVLRKPMLLEPEKAEIIVMAVVYLHNFLRRDKQSRKLYTPPGSFDYYVDGNLMQGTWRTTVGNEEQASFLPIKNVPRRSTLIAKEIRDDFTEYFMTNGRVPWQDNYA